MCEPVTIALAASAGMSAMSAMQQGQAAGAAAEENIATGEIQARDVYARVEDDKQQLAHSMLRDKATGQTQTAGGNLRVSQGSSLDWENDLLETYVSDKAAIDENASREVYGIQRGMRLEKMAGDSAKRAGAMNAGASLLSGAGAAGSQWQTYNKKPA